MRIYNIEMLNRKLFPLVVLLCLFPDMSHAQSVQVNFEKKVILCDSLNFPSNITVHQLLYLLPEMLNRPGNVSFEKYDIKVEGMSVNEASDVALSHLHIEDVEKVEVEESPIASYLKNGVGGSVNIVLRKNGRKSDKIWGSASLAASYPLDISPEVLVGHHSEKFMARGLILGDIYNNNSDQTREVFNDENQLLSAGTNHEAYRYRSQLASAFLQFMPNSKNNFKLNVSESYKYYSCTETPNMDNSSVSTNKSKDVNLNALVNWEHRFTPRTKTIFETQYRYNPGSTDKYFPSVQKYKDSFRNHNVGGKFEFQTALLPARNRNSLNLKAGCNFNFVLDSHDIYSHIFVTSSETNANPSNNTYFVQPYLTLDFTSGKFRAKAITQFQHFRYNIDRMVDNYNISRNDFTGTLLAEYHFTPHKNLRLIFERKLSRPNGGQLFPTMIFDYENINYVKGNPLLTPAMSHVVYLDYISDYTWGEHSLLFNVGASYNNVTDIINSVKTGNSPDPGSFGKIHQYVTYENNGIDRIINVNAMLLYEYKSFSLGVTGNVYHKVQTIGDDRNHYTNYNISITPQFRIPGGWQGSAQFVYNSSVKRKNESLSDCAIAKISVGRRWRNLYVYVYDYVALQKYAEDRTFNPTDNTISYRQYEMTPNLAGVGVRYSF